MQKYNPSMQIIIFDYYFSKLNILYDDTLTNSTQAVKRLHENAGEKIDGVSFQHNEKILYDNDKNLDENGCFYFEYCVKHTCDIVSDFVFVSPQKHKLTYIIGGVVCEPDEFKEFIVVASGFHEMKIRITFDHFEHDFFDKSDTYLRFKECVLKNDARKLLMTNRIETRYVIYENGLCEKIKHEDLILPQLK